MTITGIVGAVMIGLLIDSTILSVVGLHRRFCSGPAQRAVAVGIEVASASRALLVSLSCMK